MPNAACFHLLENNRIGEALRAFFNLLNPKSLPNALSLHNEHKETTVTNPPAEKKESNTTVVNPPTQKKESNTTVINPSQNQSPTTTKEKTEINVNTSPSPH